MTRVYNEAGQLVQQKDIVIGTGEIINQFDFVYDAAGNIVEESLSEPDIDLKLEMTYTAANRLATYDDSAVLFDADGNMTEGPLKDGMAEFRYDSRNRLVGAGNTAYRYDAENQRIGVNQTQYVVNSQPLLSQVLVKTEADGTQTYYVYGLGLIGQEQGSEYLTYHFDFRGSTSALTDETGQVTERFQYSPYGLLVSDTVPETPFLFNGMYGVMTDESSGLYYMRARYYHPLIRQFVNMDVLLGTVADGPTLNRYAYVTGQPVSHIDPFGLEGVLIFTTEANPERNEYQPWAYAAQYQYSKVNEELSIVYFGLFIEFHDVQTVTEVNNILSTTPDIVRIIFIGHSSSKAIYVGSSDAPDTNISERGSKNDVAPQNMNWDNLTSNARIEILGCQAGKGENSIAQALANASGVSVIAPDVNLNFDADGKPFIRWFRSGKWITFYPKKTQ